MTKGQILMVVTSCEKMPDGHLTGLWLEEFAVPYEEFIAEGYGVDVASINGGKTPIDPRSNPTSEQVQAWAGAVAALQNTASIGRVTAGDYVAVFLPGGHGTMFDFPQSKTLQALLSQFVMQNKVIAAVCHGPAGLISVRNTQGNLLVSGKRMAVFTDSEERAVGLDKKMPFLLESCLREVGANIVTAHDWADHVEEDGNLITGQNPQSSRTAARAVTAKLASA